MPVFFFARYASHTLWTAAIGCCFATPLAAQVELSGYQKFTEFHADLEALAESEPVELTSLGVTAEGRAIDLLTLSNGDPSAKPAVLVLGSVDATNLVGSELAVRMARQIATQASEGQSMLDDVTLYIIPRPSPDASERVFSTPTSDASVNSRSTDNDRDGAVDEDPPDDLNGDGVITSIRVADPAGEWMPHPDDPRVLIKADAAKNETGEYQLYTEGVDNDQDEAFNEDGPGGVDFNRNFAFNYPYFAGDAGPHQVSEPETRAVADFAYDQRNIFLVFSFAPQDNLTKPWTTSDKDGGRIKKRVLKEDEAYYKFVSELYGKKVGKEHAPAAVSDAGAFVPWAYFHYGRWSLATRGWWIPEVEQKPADEAETTVDSKEGDSEADEKKSDEESGEKEKKEEKPKDKRGAEDINALAWFDEQKIDGFIPWTMIEHPDFPEKQVEVGGFKPLLRNYPPIDQLDDLAEKHLAFLQKSVELRARLKLAPVEIEQLGPGVYRITAAVLNEGYLPTASAMGKLSKQLQRFDIELILPKGAGLVTGHTRQDLGVLAGGGGRAEKSWLVRLGKPNRPATFKLKLRAGEPSVGYCEQEVSISDAE